MQNVGAAWLMVSLHAGPGYVALIQTAASLPYFYSHYRRVPPVISSIAADSFYYRSLDDGGSADSGGSDHERHYFALAAARADICPLRRRAFETPTWRAILPELVSKDDLARHPL